MSAKATKGDERHKMVVTFLLPVGVRAMAQVVREWILFVANVVGSKIGFGLPVMMVRGQRVSETPSLAGIWLRQVTLSIVDFLRLVNRFDDSELDFLGYNNMEESMSLNKEKIDT